ncbi:MAG: topoisomerase DNA-binding C4 zinc finger domain-containing protein [Magnetococcales bacterium]|nr:topoisomerase DNA-binding C4 zinc finger domain-containing protein [Magnetococcales bacterium]
MFWLTLLADLFLLGLALVLLVQRPVRVREKPVRLRQPLFPEAVLQAWRVLDEVCRGRAVIHAQPAWAGLLTRAVAEASLPRALDFLVCDRLDGRPLMGVYLASTLPADSSSWFSRVDLPVMALTRDLMKQPEILRHLLLGDEEEVAPVTKLPEAKPVVAGRSERKESPVATRVAETAAVGTAEKVEAVEVGRVVAEKVVPKEVGGESEGKVCPRCGSSMGRRQVKQGPQAGRTVLACVRFPECRTVLPLPEKG